MIRSPAFQWYPRDILSSARVQQMSLAEEGAYRRLLDYCWLNGSVPADPTRAARLIGKGATVKMAGLVLSMFQSNPNDPSTLIHDRLEQERIRQDANREKKRLAANTRWKADEPERADSEHPQSTRNADADADAMQAQCPSSSPSSSLATKDKRVSRDKWLEDLQQSEDYRHLDVRATYASAEDWYQTNAVTLTRARFLRWLNSEKQKQANTRSNGARKAKDSTYVGAPSPPLPEDAASETPDLTVDEILALVAEHEKANATQ